MPEGIYYCALTIASAIYVGTSILLLFRKTGAASDDGAYRSAGKCLSVLFLLTAVDLVASMLLNYYGVPTPHFDIAVDVFLYTPIALLFLRFVSLLIHQSRPAKNTLPRDQCIWLAVMVGMGVSTLLDDSVRTTVFYAVIFAWGLFILTIIVGNARQYRHRIRELDSYFSTDFRARTAHIRRAVAGYIGWGMFCPVATAMPWQFNTAYALLGSLLAVYLTWAFTDFHPTYTILVRQRNADRNMARGLCAGPAGSARGPAVMGGTQRLPRQEPHRRNPSTRARHQHSRAHTPNRARAQLLLPQLCDAAARGRRQDDANGRHQRSGERCGRRPGL